MALRLPLPWCRLADGALILGFALCASAAALRIGLTPREPLAGVAVVFAPWTDPAVALARAAGAGGRLVRVGALRSIVVVAPNDVGYVDRVLAAGALLVLDPKILALCAPAPSARGPAR